MALITLEIKSQKNTVPSFCGVIHKHLDKAGQSPFVTMDRIFSEVILQLLSRK